jgi:hypothetical protein
MAPMSAPDPMPILRAVRGRHLDDRLDAVVVDEEGEQHEERLAVAAQRAQRASQAREAAATGWRGGLARLEPARGRAPQEEGRARRATHSATERKARRAGSVRALSEIRGLREAEPLRLLDQRRFAAASRPPPR